MYNYYRIIFSTILKCHLSVICLTYEGMWRNELRRCGISCCDELFGPLSRVYRHPEESVTTCGRRMSSDCIKTKTNSKPGAKYLKLFHRLFSYCSGDYRKYCFNWIPIQSYSIVDNHDLKDSNCLLFCIFLVIVWKHLHSNRISFELFSSKGWELLVLKRLKWDVSSVVAIDYLDYLLVRLSPTLIKIKTNKISSTSVDSIIRRHSSTFISLCTTG